MQKQELYDFMEKLYENHMDTYVEKLENEYIALETLQKQNILTPLDHYSLRPKEIILNENDFEKLTWKLDGIYYLKKKMVSI